MINRALPAVSRTDLVNALFFIGPTVHGLPVGLAEIESYSKNIETLNAWEFETLRLMSKFYANQMKKALDPDCIPPWEITTEEKVSSEDIRKAFSGFSRTKKVKK